MQTKYVRTVHTSKFTYSKIGPSKIVQEIKLNDTDLLSNFFVPENTQSLDCFKCGLKESDNVICEDFDPGAVEYKEKCSNDVLSCIKVFGTYDNITGR